MGSIDKVLGGLKTVELEISAGEESGKDVPQPSHLLRDMFKSLVFATKASNSIPSGDQDFHYYLNSDSVFRKRSHACGSVALRVIDQLLQRAHVPRKRQLQQLEDASDPESFDILIDVFDKMMEDADALLDEATGNTAHKQVALMKGQLQFPRESRHIATQQNSQLIGDDNRPQDTFLEKVDNSRFAFVPKLKSKPNALVPLNLRLLDEDDTPYYSHPYEIELTRLEYQPWQYEAAQNPKIVSIEETSCTWVDTEASLLALLDTLTNAQEIAIDLENHSYRSFSGFVCLMQLSTREEDFLVDTIALRDKLQVLNGVFTNPQILKVLHGSDSDIVWLQRDFGIYIVNMFDTGQAARVLGYPGFSLAYLLQLHCQKKVDKSYQLADWRIRPLTPEMKKYAQEDTHYLLYIYDKMKNELLAQSSVHNLVDEVLRRSKELCLHRFEKSQFTSESYLEAIGRLNLRFKENQKAVFEAVYEWRDTIARELDESTDYVMPRHMLIKLSNEMPRTTEELHRCCNPVPAVIRKFSHELVETIAIARSAVEKSSLAGTSASNLPSDEKIHHEQPKTLRTTARHETTTVGGIDKTSPFSHRGQVPFKSSRKRKLPSGTYSITPVKISSPISRVLFANLESSPHDDEYKASLALAKEIGVQVIADFLALVKATLKAGAAAETEVAEQKNFKAASEPSVPQPTPEEDQIPLSINESYTLPGRAQKKSKISNGSNGQPVTFDANQTATVGSEADKSASSFADVKLQESSPSKDILHANESAKTTQRAEFKRFDYAAASSSSGIVLNPTAYTANQQIVKSSSTSQIINPFVAAAHGIQVGDPNSRNHKNRKGKNSKSRRDRETSLTYSSIKK